MPQKKKTMKKLVKDILNDFFWSFAGTPGFEPGKRDLESRGLPIKPTSPFMKSLSAKALREDAVGPSLSAQILSTCSYFSAGKENHQSFRWILGLPAKSSLHAFAFLLVCQLSLRPHSKQFTAHKVFFILIKNHFISLCKVCFLHFLQNFLSWSFFVPAFFDFLL